MFLESRWEGLLVGTWSYFLATHVFCDLMLRIKALEEKGPQSHHFLG